MWNNPSGTNVATFGSANGLIARRGESACKSACAKPGLCQFAEAGYTIASPGVLRFRLYVIADNETLTSRGAAAGDGASVIRIHLLTG